MFTRTLNILLLVILLAANWNVSNGANPARRDNKIGTISFLIGAPTDVRLQHQDSAVWYTAKLRMEVKNGDVIRTEKESRCEVKLNDGSIIRIGEETTFDFTDAIISSASKKVSSKLKRGKIWANLRRFIGKKDRFRILAPTAVCAVRGTIYRMDADSTTRVAVYDGEVDIGPVSFWGQAQQPRSKSLEPVEVPGPYEIPGPYEVSLEEWVRIVKGFQIKVRGDGKFAKLRIDRERDARDEWVRWNQERDRLIGQ